MTALPLPIRMRVFCLPVFLALLALPGRLPAAPEAAFTEANAVFESGDHEGAAKAYEKLAREGHLSPELFYNLGAAKFRSGKEGEAILWMRRALHLDPGMAEARQSLRYLQGRLAYFEFAGGGFDRFLSSLPARFTDWTASLLLWTGLLAAGAAFAFPTLRIRRASLVTFALVAGMAAMVAWRAGRYRAERIAPENFATVTAGEVSALTAPVPGAKPVVGLPPGSELRLLQQSGPWYYAEIPGDLRGWVRRESIEPVWPVGTTISDQ